MKGDWGQDGAGNKYGDNRAAGGSGGTAGAASVSGTYNVAPAIISLADNADNSTTINTAYSFLANVTLSGRTLYKDGKWNTLCLPFDVVIAGSPLAGAEVRGLDNANLTDGVLTLNFTAKGAVTTIEAGRPYIIRWDKAEGYVDDDAHNLVSPVFSGVTIDDTNRDVTFTGGAFKGTYAHISWTEETPSILFMGAGNKLNWPLSGASLGACRAYFQLADGAEAREFKLNFSSEETTNISAVARSAEGRLLPEGRKNSTLYTLHSTLSEWYTLDGRKLDKKPTRKGLYIYGGRKVVIP